jgi:hypothetical protein
MTPVRGLITGLTRVIPYSGQEDTSKHLPSLRRKPEPRDQAGLLTRFSWIPACAGTTRFGPDNTSVYFGNGVNLDIRDGSRTLLLP